MQGNFPTRTSGAVARCMHAKLILDVQDDTGPIPLNNVTMNVLKKVIPLPSLGLVSLRLCWFLSGEEDRC
jgi:hypothetical protein